MFCSVHGGWRETQFSECSEVCGPGIKRKRKICDNPAPAGGDLCPCDDPNGCLEDVIEESCNEGPCQGKTNFPTIYYHDS